MTAGAQAEGVAAGDPDRVVRAEGDGPAPAAVPGSGSGPGFGSEFRRFPQGHDQQGLPGSARSASAPRTTAVRARTRSRRYITLKFTTGPSMSLQSVGTSPGKS